MNGSTRTREGKNSLNMSEIGSSCSDFTGVALPDTCHSENDQLGIEECKVKKDVLILTEKEKRYKIIKRMSEPGNAHIKIEFVNFNHEKKLAIYLKNSEKRKGVESDDNSQKKFKGRNKKRQGNKRRDLDGLKMCREFLLQSSCTFGDECKFLHNRQEFLDQKGADLGDACYMFEQYGFCPFNITCRFGKSHIDENGENISRHNEGSFEAWTPPLNETKSQFQMTLRKKQYNFNKAHGIYMKLNDSKNSSEAETGGKGIGPVAEAGKINFSNKLYLAPLTTVGNLPFRRICKGLGADVTCSEMAVATCLLQAQRSELALLKRHHSEDIFGIQICGAHPEQMIRCAQLLDENFSMDFVDINCGCPIDMIFQRGEGSALMTRHRRLLQVVDGMRQVLRVPLTVKLRTGVYENKHVAHLLIPKLRDSRVSLVTLHGRSREQRYTKLANWDYIRDCAKHASPMPLFGNGDILTYEDYNSHMEGGNIQGTMIARGALIKPWIFTEIKEQRHWDISSSERLDILKKFSNYGLEHWGSDQQGVNNTRRFLLEWLSFTHRYIPIGILERVPQKINEKPYHYFGRNDLETLMGSAHCDDWVKISEMLLGPVPSGFEFVPKHRANSYV